MQEDNEDIKIWARDKAVLIHDKTADWFAGKYINKEDYFASSFSYGRKQINRHLFNEISKLPKNAKILDVGCGTGEHLKKMLDMGFSAKGIEPSEKMREHAESNLPKDTVIRGSVLNLPFNDNYFDFVYAIEVFRYLQKEDNIKGLQEIFRVLKPGAVFFGTFLNFYALDGFFIVVCMRKLIRFFFKKNLDFHSEFETPKSLEKKFNYSGFSKVSFHGAMFAFLVIFYKINKNFGKFCAKVLDSSDFSVSDTPILRQFANYLIGIAKK